MMNIADDMEDVAVLEIGALNMVNHLPHVACPVNKLPI
jgi:hypothetical protein